MKKLLVMVIVLGSVSSFASEDCAQKLYSKMVWENPMVSTKVTNLNAATIEAVNAGDIELARKLTKKNNDINESAELIANIVCE